MKLFQVTAADWTYIPNVNPSVVSRHILLPSAGSYRIRSLVGAKFMAWLYSVIEGDCAQAAPIDYNYKATPQACTRNIVFSLKVLNY